MEVVALGPESRSSDFVADAAAALGAGGHAGLVSESPGI